MNRRVIAIALGVVAAACLITAALTDHWLVNSSAEAKIGFGLRNNEECLSTGWTNYEPLRADEHRAEPTSWTCKSASNSVVVDQWKALEKSHGDRLASSAFAPFGWITFVDVLVAALGLLAAAGIAAARKQPQLPIMPTTVALVGLMIGLITGCVFVATKPGPAGMVGVGLSFWLFGAGSVIGIAGAQLLAKVNRPADVDLMADAMNPDEY